jgi:hypothetical protein
MHNSNKLETLFARRIKHTTMNKRIIHFIFLSLFSIAAMAQNGIAIKTGPFTSFEISQPLDVYIHQSDSSYIELKGSGVDADKVRITNVNGNLIIEVSGSANINSKIHIYTKKYTGITMGSASDLHTIGQLNGDELMVDASGASDGNLSIDYSKVTVSLSGASDLSIYGRADELIVDVSGASDFDSYGAKNTNTTIIASGSSDVSVNPDSNLIAEITGASELHFKKEPAHKVINSSGSSEYGQKSNSGEGVEFNDMSVYENGDTVKIDLGDGKREIVIIDGEEGVRIKSKRCRVQRFKGNWAGLELGVNGYMTPEGGINMPTGFEFLELKYEKSTNFNINFFQQSFNLAGNKLGLVTGLGIRWNNYRFANNVILSGDSSEIYGYPDTDPTRSYTKSKLTASYLMLPLLLEFQTNSHHRSNSFHIGLGVIGGVKMGSHTKQVYTTTGGGKQKQKTKDSFHLQPFILDATARVGWGPINLFATYSLIDMFREDRGPALRPFSVGIILPFT